MAGTNRWQRNKETQAFLVALDDLREADGAPRTQPRPATLPRVHGIAPGFPHGPDLGPHAVRRDQPWPMGGTARHTRDPPPEQNQVTRRAALAAQPQARADHQGQGHPADAARLLDTDCVGWPVPQGAWRLDARLRHRLPLASSACPPTRHRPLVGAPRDDASVQGHPWASRGPTRQTGAAGVRRRYQAVPGVARKVVGLAVPRKRWS